MKFDQYLEQWKLTADGAEFSTNYGHLLPVRYRGLPAMLKIAVEEEERRGADLMIWWDGDGAVRVYEQDGPALLMERAMGTRSLIEMALNGQDDEATRVLCDAAANLHAPRDRPNPALIPLVEWFAPLAPAAVKHGGILVQADETARELLDSEQDIVVLHGDIHHGNILDCGERGWLAIDPKRLIGERGFDFVNILLNPPSTLPYAPGRFARQVDIISETAHLNRTRFLKWILAFTGLSAAWILNDGNDPRHDLTIAGFAADELAKDKIGLR